MKIILNAVLLAELVAVLGLLGLWYLDVRPIWAYALFGIMCGATCYPAKHGSSRL